MSRKNSGFVKSPLETLSSAVVELAKLSIFVPLPAE